MDLALNTEIKIISNAYSFSLFLLVLESLTHLPYVQHVKTFTQHLKLYKIWLQATAQINYCLHT